jgi:hypothetical protein
LNEQEGQERPLEWRMKCPKCGREIRKGNPQDAVICGCGQWVWYGHARVTNGKKAESE